jgi:hypothetical protein
MAEDNWNRHENGDILTGWLLSPDTDPTDGVEFAIELAGGMALAASLSAAFIAAATLI